MSAYTSCLLEHNEDLIRRLSLAVMAENFIVCSLQHDYEDKCKNEPPRESWRLNSLRER